MKKTLFTSAILLLLAQFASAQTYQFSMSNATYPDLASPTVISTPGWDDESFSIPVPFAFNLYGDNVLLLEVWDGSIISPQGEIDIIYADLHDNGSSVISYQVVGTAPNRILKVQWKNVGFVDGQVTDFANFQAWLYEGSNIIEGHYATITTSPSAFDPGPGPGVAIYNGTFLKNIQLSGSPGNPTVYFNSSTEYALTSSPYNGTIFTFTPATGTGLNEQPASVINAGPNPFHAELSISIADQLTPTNIFIYDLQGKLMQQESFIYVSECRLNTESLPAGIYMLVMNSGSEVRRMKVFKQ